MKLAEFAAWAIREGPFDGCNLDGFSVQEKALELGLLRRDAYDPNVHGESDCHDPGDVWFEFSDEFKAELKEAAPRLVNALQSSVDQDSLHTSENARTLSMNDRERAAPEQSSPHKEPTTSDYIVLVPPNPEEEGYLRQIERAVCDYNPDVIVGGPRATST